MGDYSDCRLVASHMGMRARRMISAYPTKKRWKKWALQEAARRAAGDRSLAAHQELIRSLDRVLLPTSRAYRNEIAWLENAIRQQSIEPFDCILASSNASGRTDVLTVSEVSGDHPRWNLIPGMISRVEVRDELSGEIHSVGDRFLALVGGAIPDLAERFRGSNQIASIEIRDRYLKSPLAFRLVIEVAAALMRSACGAAASCEVALTTIYMTGDASGTRSLVQHDWAPGIRRSDILARVSREIGVALRLEEVLRRESTHFRAITVTWVDGARWTVLLDEGFGFLEPSASNAFDFNATPEAQASALLSARLELRRRSSQPSLLFVGQIET